ncbi:MAG: PLP-dependent aminotransferase family protein [Lachnospiraceae bacterium]|nr:PLP-dependent aminotransferase family protein [Lachnospiraceae bacterium]
MIFNLQKKGAKPIYEYLYESIRDEIISGKLKSGDKLPSRRQMALDNGIAEITVANAYAQLVTEGYIESREKSGYFVSRDIDLIPETGIKTRREETCPVKRFLCKKKEQAARNKIINLSNSGLPEETFPFDTWSKLARKSLTEDRAECIKAPEVRGLQKLRESIAGYLERSRGFAPDPEHIIVGPGTEYLCNVLLSLLDKDAAVALEDPGYRNIGRLFEGSGHKCYHLSVDENGLITSELKGKGIKLLHVSPSHHFPLGCVMSAPRRASLVSWAEEESAWIIEDDYDSEFRFEGRPVPPVVAYEQERVIYMNTFSRTLSPSIRIAYMVLPSELYEVFMEKFMYHSGSVSTLEQLTLASFISAGYYERHLNRVRNYYKKRKKAIFDTATDKDIAEFFDIEGDGSGMTFILKCNTDTDDKYQEVLARHGVLINPLKEYYYGSSDYSDNRYVVNFGYVNEEQFKNAAQTMCKALRVKKCRK